MARTAEQLLARLYELLPEDLESSEGEARDAHLFGLATALAQADATVEAMIDQAKVDPGAGIWLSLHARGLGYVPLDGETDPQLRIRIRNVENKLTRPAILAALDELLATVTDPALPSYMWERKDGTGQAVEDEAVEEGAISVGWNMFFLYLPLLPPEESAGAVGEEAVGEAWIELVLENVLYPVIRAEVDRIRAAGVRVFYLYYLEE